MTGDVSPVAMFLMKTQGIWVFIVAAAIQQYGSGDNMTCQNWIGDRSHSVRSRPPQKDSWLKANKRGTRGNY